MIYLLNLSIIALIHERNDVLVLVLLVFMCAFWNYLHFSTEWFSVIFSLQITRCKTMHLWVRKYFKSNFVECWTVHVLAPLDRFHPRVYFFILQKNRLDDVIVMPRCGVFQAKSKYFKKFYIPNKKLKTFIISLWEGWKHQA